MISRDSRTDICQARPIANKTSKHITKHPLWMNVPFMEDVQFWINVPFLDECAIFGGICHYWMNVSFMEECDIFGGMCHFWMNVPFIRLD